MILGQTYDALWTEPQVTILDAIPTQESSCVTRVILGQTYDALWTEPQVTILDAIPM